MFSSYIKLTIPNALKFERPRPEFEGPFRSFKPPYKNTLLMTTIENPVVATNPI